MAGIRFPLWYLLLLGIGGPLLFLFVNGRAGVAPPFSGVTSPTPTLVIPYPGAAPLPNSPVTYQAITARPESHLYFPGSLRHSKFGGPEIDRSGTLGGEVAFAGGVATSRYSMSVIYAWYDHRLRSHGWVRDDGVVGHLSTWKTWHGYSRGKREIFVVAEDYPTLIGYQLRWKPPCGRAVYEIQYSILPTHPMP